MLTIAHLQSPDQKREYLEEFLRNSGVDNGTWVVSDLRNKFEVQQILLQTQESFEDLSVLRASELWRYLLKRSHPEMQLVSRDFVRLWVQEQLRREEIPQSAQADQVVIEMMDLMISVHCHPRGGEMMRGWFQENPESLQRWGGWFLFSEAYVAQLRKAQRITASWIAPFLQEEKDWQPFWQRPLIFDLGSQLSQAECEIVRSLARSCEVLVLAPSKKRQQEYEYLLKPYKDLEAQADKRREPRTPPQTSKSLSMAKRFSGVLAEAKMTCEMVREWLNAGVSPQEVAVIAPDIEMYWPYLQPLFTMEGIPVNKEISVRLQNLPSVSCWLADLRLHSKEVRFSDLENSVYSRTPELRFEEFQALFSELISDHDLNRHQSIQQAYRASFSSQDEMDLNQFLGFALRFWKRGEDFLPLEIALREMLAASDFFGSLRMGTWLQFLEQIVAKKEIRLQRALTSGVQLSNLSAADSLKITHRYFLGLSENLLRTKKSSLLQPKEILSMASQLGFNLEHPEIHSQEFDLVWLGENKQTASIYSFPQTGFSGAAEAPASYWVEKAAEISPDQLTTLSLPLQTRWDDWIGSHPPSALTQELKWSEPQAALSLEQNQRDRGLASLGPLKLQKDISLSASSLEAYRNCPFIFAAQKIFRLMDLPVLDLDVDRRTRGQLAHALLERISAEPRRFDWEERDIYQILTSLRAPLGLQKMDEFVWASLCEKHVVMAKRFLSFEAEWKRQFPETYLMAREKSFEFHWDAESGQASASRGWKIRGKVDRIDRDNQGHLVVIDYKVSPGDYKNHNSWLEKNQLQLGLYMMALQEGLVSEIPAAEVVGAFYYILKTMKRDFGLKVEEKSGTLFDLDKKRNRLSTEDKDKLLETIRQVINETILHIQAGDIEPRPLDPETCTVCHWRNLCRAPHLN